MSKELDRSFAEVVSLIQASRQKAYKAVNTVLVELYWQVGEYVSKQVEADNWGKGTVRQLSAHIQQQLPEARGFSSQNLWRMKQFYEAYRGNEKLSTLLRELPWSHNLAIESFFSLFSNGWKGYFVKNRTATKGVEGQGNNERHEGHKRDMSPEETFIVARGRRTPRLPDNKQTHRAPDGVR